MGALGFSVLAIFGLCTKILRFFGFGDLQRAVSVIFRSQFSVFSKK